MERPRACVLKTDGINCEKETASAWELAGGAAKIVHMNDLLWGKDRLTNYQACLWPGGFAHGDYLKAGVVLGQEIIVDLGDQLRDFVKNKGIILGICNGFQGLTRCGLLPYGKINTPETAGEIDATLIGNDVGHFRADLVDLKVERGTPCEFIANLPDQVKYMVAHGEGKFYAPPKTIATLETENLVVFRYVDRLGNLTQEYPQNPNGALNAIAGICDPSGRILGLMPHPERFVLKHQYDNWRRDKNIGKPHGLPLFEGMVSYARGS